MELATYLLPAGLPKLLDGTSLQTARALHCIRRRLCSRLHKYLVDLKWSPWQPWPRIRSNIQHSAKAKSERGAGEESSAVISGMKRRPRKHRRHALPSGTRVPEDSAPTRKREPANLAPTLSGRAIHAPYLRHPLLLARATSGLSCIHRDAVPMLLVMHEDHRLARSTAHAPSDIDLSKLGDGGAFPSEHGSATT
jgi:hypothetical protein